jgi:predicted nucleic acid-binding protein
VILPDTSAWIAFFRGLDHPVRRALRDILEAEGDLATAEPIVLELLAGARSDREARDMRDRLHALPLLRLEGLADYERAAGIFRACRRGGETVRSLIDCLIAVPAIRSDAEVLHLNRDFDAIARHTPLRIYETP